MDALSPPPTRIPIVDDDGNMPPVWQRWFLRLYARVGVQQASSNKDIDVVDSFEAVPVVQVVSGSDPFEGSSAAIVAAAISEIQAALAMQREHQEPPPQSFARSMLLMGG